MTNYIYRRKLLLFICFLIGLCFFSVATEANAAVPLATDDSYSVDEDSRLNIIASGVLANDSDVDGDLLSAVLDTTTSSGTLTLNADGSFTYTPNANFNGTDSFTYYTNDGTADSNTATVTITIVAVSDAPTNDTLPVISGTLEEGQVLSATAGTWANNSNPVGAITYTYQWHRDDDGVAGGELDIAGATSSSYSLSANDRGKYLSVAVTVAANGESSTAVSAFTGPVVNSAPVIDQGEGPLQVTMSEDGLPTAFVAPSLSATDANSGDTLTWSVAGAASHGVATVSGTGASPTTFTYMPAANYNGTDSFLLQVSDGTATDTIQVDVTIEPINDAPVANDDSYIVAEGQTFTVEAASGLLSNDSGVDGDTLSVVVVSDPSNGSLSLNADGSFTYVHDGTETTGDSFTYEVSDANSDTAQAMVTITISLINDAPVITGQNPLNTPEETALTITLNELTVTDPDNTYPDDFTLTVQDGTNYSRAGNTITPSVDFNGTLTVPVTVNDGTTGVTLQWDANTEPNLFGYRIYYKEGASGNQDLAAYDGSGLTYVGEPYDGQVVNSGFEIKKSDLPDPDASTVTCQLTGFSENDVYYFLVTAYDNEGFESEPSSEVVFPFTHVSNVFNLSVEVTSVNDAPVVNVPPNLIIEDGNSLTFTIEATDLEGDALTINATALPHGASFADNGDGTGKFTWTPSYRDAGGYNVLFTVTDSGTPPLSGSATVTITVIVTNIDTDGMPDNWEIAYFGDLSQGPFEDYDEDGLGNLAEYQQGTNPIIDDTDGDGMPDGWEVAYGFDPTDGSGINGRDGDLDDDGWNNYEEYINGTDPSDVGSRPTPTPPQILEAIPHPDAGISDNMRVPHNTSFAILLQDSDGIDIADTDSIKFTIDDRVNEVYARDLNDTRVVRVVQLSDDDNTQVTSLWAIYDRSQDIYGYYSYASNINIKVDVKDRRGDWMEQASYDFKIETEIEHNEAQINLPDTIPVDLNDPALGGSYDTGIQVVSGELEGAKIVYASSEPVTPIFGPMDELPAFDLEGEQAVGLAMNLQPPTIFNTPVKIFIPCPNHSDVSTLNIYHYNGTDWVLANDADAAHTVQPGGLGWMVEGSRRNHNLADNPANDPSTIEIQVYHFSGAQAGSTSSSSSSSGGSGRFIATGVFGSKTEGHVKILAEFRDERLLTNRFGRRFVDVYYRLSPPVADYLRRHPSARAVVRYALIPVTGVAYLALRVHPLALFLITTFLITGAILCYRRYRSARQRA